MQKFLKVFGIALVIGMVCVSVLGSVAGAEKVFALPDNTFIFPGHGPPSKVGIERYLNLDINEEF